MIWNKDRECISKDELRALQSEGLKKVVRRVYDNVPVYRDKMLQAGVTPEDIQSVDDLSRLPFTNKSDIRDNYPYGLFAAPMEDIVRIQGSSGTTGKLTIVGYTRNDLNVWSEVAARSLTCAGVTKKSIVQVSYGYGLFTGGLGAHGGAELIGATVIPMSGGNTERQVTVLRDLKATALACTPSYALHIADTMDKMGVKKEELSLKAGIFGAEPWTAAMRGEIENRLGITCYDIYGLAEVIGPGVAIECGEHNGLHIFEDHFIAEIIDPKTLQPVPDGEPGELVFTTITKEGMPLIRYRTRDLTRIIPESCPCGRTHRRMEKILGRSDDMIVIRGVNVFPTQIETILIEMGDLEPHYLLVVDRDNNMDNLEVWVEMSQHLFSDEVKVIEQAERRLKERMHTILGISARVKLVEPGTIPRSEGKAKRIQDNRKK